MESLMTPIVKILLQHGLAGAVALVLAFIVIFLFKRIEKRNDELLEQANISAQRREEILNAKAKDISEAIKFFQHVCESCRKEHAELMIKLEERHQKQLDEFYNLSRDSFKELWLRAEQVIGGSTEATKQYCVELKTLEVLLKSIQKP